MNGTEFIAKILKAEGIDSVTCFPSNPLIEAVAKEGIRPISFRNERGAVMAADGFSRISQRKKFGVAIVQSQAGAENAMRHSSGLRGKHSDTFNAGRNFIKSVRCETKFFCIPKLSVMG